MTTSIPRLAHTDDATAISALIHSVSHFFTLREDGVGAELFFASITPEAIHAYLTSPRYVYWVLCDDDERIIATIALRDLSHVYHFFVHPEAQGQGLGRRLWRCLLDFVAAYNETGALTVNASLVARDMYAHFGFVVTDQVQEMHGLRYLPMRLDLPVAKQ